MLWIPRPANYAITSQLSCHGLPQILLECWQHFWADINLLCHVQVLGMVDKILRERADDIPLDMDRAVRPMLHIARNICAWN